jgi:uncharacterized membrane protein YcaP (DUF421 family)
MDAVIRALTVYAVLLLVFRLAGRRTLTEMTSFDFVLLLIISEATQNAMIGNDYSITNGMLVVVTLVGLDILLTNWKHRSAFIERWLDGLPMIIVEHGRPLKSLMDRARLDEEDVLAAARKLQGLERMDQIKYAVLEVGGGISIVPQKTPDSQAVGTPPN